MSKPTLEDTITKALSTREDIWLDDAVSADEACPSIRGIQIRRAKETEVRAPDSYNPFNYVGWMYYGQAFAIETDIQLKSKRPLTKEQEQWRDDFEYSGGIYVMARTIDDVYEALGRERPEPWSDYETRSTKVPREK